VQSDSLSTKNGAGELPHVIETILAETLTRYFWIILHVKCSSHSAGTDALASSAATARAAALSGRIHGTASFFTWQPPALMS
jgi:hypothetical protein